VRLNTKESGRNNPAASRVPFPFTAIVGQEEMKLSLILSAIDPLIGGVLIMGNRGTGKSTAVRAIADLLPGITRIKGCIYGCDPAAPSEWCSGCLDRRNGGRRLPSDRGCVPVVELPLGATEDRVCGSLDIERALREGVRAFQPGLLAKANRGFLYIDEVNLLEDHLVDLLLDVAASGWNIIEREGISVRHPARFVLVGSGNPEEGELRPQLLDRFGLHAKVSTLVDIDERLEIVRRRERFERDRALFQAGIEPAQASLRRKLVRAKRLLDSVEMEDGVLARIAELCIRLGIDGHRGELTIARAARALAAFEGRRRVAPGDARRVSVMSLRHRLRRDALGEIDAGGRIERAIEKTMGTGADDTN
jgi:magnesium chelatase subunit I